MVHRRDASGSPHLRSCPVPQAMRKGRDGYPREMVLYTRNRSLRCWRAKRLLGRAGYRLEVVAATSDPGAPPGPPGGAHPGRGALAPRLPARAGSRSEVVDAASDPGALAALPGADHREVAPPYVF